MVVYALATKASAVSLSLPQVAQISDITEQTGAEFIRVTLSVTYLKKTKYTSPFGRTTSDLNDKCEVYFKYSSFDAAAVVVDNNWHVDALETIMLSIIKAGVRVQRPVSLLAGGGVYYARRGQLLDVIRPCSCWP